MLGDLQQGLHALLTAGQIRWQAHSSSASSSCSSFNAEEGLTLSCTQARLLMLSTVPRHSSSFRP